ncbi:MAG: type II secretion system protein [Betaproteobacteria bacterium]
MTLLETVIALVILSLAAIGVLELFEGSSRNASNAEAWVTAVGYAEEGIEAAKAGPGPASLIQSRVLRSGFVRQTRVVPAGEGLSDVVVSVSLPGGGTYVVHRLVAAR